jgi:uncharacterized YigZ family protein
MASSDTYKTIKAVSWGLYKEKGSKFNAAAFPVTNEPEIKSIIEDVRKEHHDARHNCYAYILGEGGHIWRANDDGEPSGTAGKPILGQIRSYRLTNVLIIVSRFFRGTLLGTSGLINAYRSAAESALSNAEIIDHVVLQTYEITYQFSVMNDVMKIIKDENINHVDHSFDNECKVTVQFRSSEQERILKRFSRIDGLDFRFISVK